MEKEQSFIMTREKHLDHMVRVVPFIVLCYAIQCYVIYQIAPDDFSTLGLSILGGFLAVMVGAFITYDLKHRVEFQAEKVHISFLGAHKKISYEDIWSVEVGDPGENFSTLVITTQNKKHSFYFVDDAEKIKSWIEAKKQKEITSEAA